MLSTSEYCIDNIKQPEILNNQCLKYMLKTRVSNPRSISSTYLPKTAFLSTNSKLSSVSIKNKVMYL